MLVFTGVAKLIFIAMVLAHGGRYLKRQAGVAVAVDLVMVALFVTYLLGTV